MKALIVEQRRLLLTQEADDGDAMCRMVEGTPEVRGVDARTRLRAYRNRDAAVLDLPVNVMATLLYRELGIVGVREMVRGNVVFMGVDGSGTVTDVPDWVIRLANGMVPEVKLIRDALTNMAN